MDTTIIIIILIIIIVVGNKLLNILTKNCNEKAPWRDKSAPQCPQDAPERLRIDSRQGEGMVVAEQDLNAVKALICGPMAINNISVFSGMVVFEFENFTLTLHHNGEWTIEEFKKDLTSETK